MMKMKDKIVVVGGGAAGLIAAATAAKNGKNVVLLEGNKILGKKLRITGKGRCNITNNCDMQDFIDNVPTNSSFLYSAFYTFTNEDVIRLFNLLGVKTKVERSGRVFPASDSAHDVADALAKHAKDSGVEICCGVKVKIITAVKGGGFKIYTTKNNEIEADKVILACGGVSYPVTGSDGSGFKIVSELGHTVTKLKPSLVPLVTKEKWPKEIAGLSLKNIKITVKNQDNLKIYEDFGEMLFTHFGVSGPVILSASSHIRNFENKNYILSIDLKPALDHNVLDKRIQRDFAKFINKDFKNALYLLLPKKLIDIIISLSQIQPHKKVHQITKQERQKLVNILKSLTLTIIGTRPIEEAIITSGGVSVNEINSSTMESKIIKDLYFAGEMIDVDAYTGGFNLQIAFSTGYLSGLSASGGKI